MHMYMFVVYLQYFCYYLVISFFPPVPYVFKGSVDNNGTKPYGFNEDGTLNEGMFDDY